MNSNTGIVKKKEKRVQVGLKLEKEVIPTLCKHKNYQKKNQIFFPLLSLVRTAATKENFFYQDLKVTFMIPCLIFSYYIDYVI